MRAWILAGGFILGMTLGSAAEAASSERFIETGGETSQPIGHYKFCQRYTAECRVRGAVPPAVNVTSGIWALVTSVNDRVNRLVKPVLDLDQYGQEEVWAYPQGAGDCEDYVLEKRRELLQAGIAAGNLLITVVRKPDGEGHAVLTLRTTRGDLVLDNLEEQVKVWSATPYHYLKRQAPYDSGRWMTIENCKDDILVGAINN